MPDDKCVHKFAWSTMRLECNKPAHVGDPEHSGLYLATTITWLDGDRRDYIGNYWPCDGLDGLCILPGAHPGGHAQ